MRNRYPGTCYFCYKHVDAFAGHFERHKSSLHCKPIWRVIHADCVFIQRKEKANLKSMQGEIDRVIRNKDSGVE
jgi:hypothetical protein